MELDQLCLVAARGLHIAACALLLGALLVRGWIAPDMPGATSVLLGRVTRRAATALLLTGLLWLVLQARDMADGDALLPAVRDVLWLTRFGHSLLARVTLTVLVLAVARPPSVARTRIGAGLAALAVATLAATGHGAAAEDAVLVLGLVIHVLAASAWLGGLLPLAFVLRTGGSAAVAAARRFSWLGLACVAGLLGGAGLQWPLIGSVAALVGTPYGNVVALKAGLLGGLLVLAGANLRAVSRASGAGRSAAGATCRLRSVMFRVWLELWLGVAAIAAASWLLQLAPAAHRQIEWPFAFRPSLTALSDGGLRHELVTAGLGLLAAMALGLLALVARRIRLPALAVGAAATLWSAPSFALLLVPAYPTSYYQSPTGFSAASVIAGAALYPVHCAGCHGAAGRGDGPWAAGSPVPPADLTAPHLWDHADGELFWWLSRGMTDWRGRRVMPGFSDALDDDQLWALIDLVRARNAGVRVAAAGADPADVERQIVGLRLRSRSSNGGFHVHHP